MQSDLRESLHMGAWRRLAQRGEEVEEGEVLLRLRPPALAGAPAALTCVYVNLSAERWSQSPWPCC